MIENYGQYKIRTPRKDELFNLSGQFRNECDNFSNEKID